MSHAPPAWVSPALARARAGRIRDLRYGMELAVDARARTLSGRQAIALALDRRGASEDLVLDWRPESRRVIARVQESLRVNGEPLPRAAVRIGDGHLVIAARHLRAGPNHIALRWQAPIARADGALTVYHDPADGAHYVYTLFVPADASRVLACFDQPDLKARFTLALTVPAGWTAIGNAPVQTVRGSGGAHVFRFAPTEPISTYLFAFAAGPFVALGSRAAPGRLWVRRSQVRHARPHVDAILGLNARAVRALARYFGHPFPFAKHDLVAIPELPYRGMEHAGATFLAEKDLFPAPGAGRSAHFERAQLLLHETAHQWAGNLVTMRGFDDLWLKEGFANFMAYKLAGRFFPRALAQVAFHRLKLQACHADETRAAGALHRPLADLALAKTAYGPSVYAKAPAVLRQLESVLGRECFARGVRIWIRRHAYGTSDWRGLVAALEDAAGIPLRRWARSWILRPGVPRLHARVDCDAGADLRVRIVQRPAGAARGAPWPLRFRVDFEHARGARESHIVQLDARHTELRLPCRAGALPRIVLDAGDDAYALVALDPAQIASAGAGLGRTRCALQRMRLWEQVWQSVRECRSDPAGFVMLALQALARERSELIVAAVLQRLQDAMDRLLAPERASSLALAVDRFLLDAAGTATPSLRPAWLEGLIAVARSREGLDALEAIARGRRDALGAPATLRCRAALMLVVRGRWDLRRAREAIQACGCASMPVLWQLAAARPSAGSKRDVLEALLTHRRATDEAIVGALGLLNHPAHAALAAPLLAPALQALPGLHRRRKIFFVNRWIDAFVGGQGSERACRIVERAIARAGLDDPLRRRLEQARHELARVIAVRSRWANSAAPGLNAGTGTTRSARTARPPSG